MRFEDIRVGMKLQFVKEGRGFLKGEVVLVEMIDGSDRSISVRDMDGDIEWIFSFDLAYIEPVQEEPCAAQEAIDYIKMYFGSTSEYEAILRKHEKEPNGWDGNLRGLNGLSIEQLRELLFGQNEQVKAAKPACLKQVISISEQQTNLSQADYMSLIDAALIIGDKQWFNELVAKTKSNEGAIS